MEPTASRRRILRAGVAGIAMIGGGQVLDVSSEQADSSAERQPDGSVSGVVEDPFGNPLADAVVRVYDNTASADEVLVTATTDSEGRFVTDPFEQAEDQFVIIDDPDTGFFYADSSINTLPTDAELDFVPRTQILSGPEIATYTDGTEMLFVTVYRTFKTPVGEDEGQLFFIELTGLRDSTDGDVGPVPSASFSLTVPEDTARVDYDGREGIDDAGVTVRLLPDDPATETERRLYDWHPSNTGGPGYETAVTSYREVTESIVNEEKREKNFIFDLAKAIPGLGELIGISEQLQKAGVVSTDTTTQLVLGQNIEPPNRNDFDVVNGVLPFATTTTVFSVPVRFTDQSEQRVVAEANWRASPFNIDVDRLRFRREFSVRPTLESDPSEEEWPMPFQNARNTSSIPRSLPQSDGLSQQWSLDIPEPVPNHIPIASDTVLVPGTEKLSALDINSGDEIWTETVEETPQTPGIYYPAVHDGVVYWSRRVGDSEWVLAALSLEDGAEQWTAPTSFCNPTVEGDRIYFGNPDGLFSYTLDGEQEWSTDLGASVFNLNPVAVFDDTVFTTDDAVSARSSASKTIYAIDRSDGTERWTHSGPLYYRENSLAGADGTLFDVSLARESRDGDSPISRVTALDTGTGDVQWQRDLDPDPPANNTGSVPAIADGTVFLHLPEYRLFALDAGSGETQWQVQLAEPSTERPSKFFDWTASLPPVVGTDSVYLASEETLFSVNRQDQSVQQISFDGPLCAVSGTDDGVLVIVQTDSGGRVEYLSSG